MRWQDSKEDGFLEETLSDFLRDISKRYGESERASQPRSTPAVSVGEADDYYIVLAELPGVSTEELKVVAGPKTLTIEGRWQGLGFDEKINLLTSETHSGFFRRVINLPGTIRGDLVRAVMENGLLEVALPKSEESGEDSFDVRI